MIVDERIGAYLALLNADGPPFCEAVRKDAEAEGVPIVRREAESLLKTLICIKKPRRILEIGTAVGYSALLMSECMPPGCEITTIESYHKRVICARDNIKKAGKEDVIKLLEGDALEILEKLEGEFDFIFMDAAKGQYAEFFRLCEPLCPQGGIVVCDNVLQEGTLVHSRYLINQRDRTIHSRMREFLQGITHREDFTTTILPVGDGMAVSVKMSPSCK